MTIRRNVDISSVTSAKDKKKTISSAREIILEFYYRQRVIILFPDVS